MNTRQVRSEDSAPPGAEWHLRSDVSRYSSVTGSTKISRSVLDRLGIYAAMKVPEVWRWDGQQLRFCLLRKGKYVESPVSRSFLMLAASEIVRFAQMQQTLGKIAILRNFRQWVREQQAQGWPSAPGKPRKPKQPRHS